MTLTLTVMAMMIVVPLAVDKLLHTIRLFYMDSLWINQEIW